MEEDATAAGSIGQPPEPEPAAPPSPRGQKRGARPDEDDAAGDGAARGSPRRALAEEEEEYTMSTMDSVEEEEEELDEPEDGGAPPARQLFDFFHRHAHPGAAAAAGSSSTAGREPVDVTLRLGVGPPADGSEGAVDIDTTLRLSSAVPALREYCGRLLRFHGKPPVVGAAPGAVSNAETGPDDGQLGFACGAAADFSQVPLPPAASEDEGFLTIDGYTHATDGFAAGDVAGRPSSVPDLNQPSPSASPDGGVPGPSHVSDPAPAANDECPSAAVAEQRHRPTAPFIDLFCSPAQDVRAPTGVLTADSS